MEKTCRQCDVTAPVAEFYRKLNIADGRQSICKSCHRENMRINRAINRSRIIEYESVRNAMPHRVAARKAYRRTPAGRASKAGEKIRCPIQHAARQAVRNAVRRGVLTRQPCEVCGNPKSQAHHGDYSKPLDVRWLCSKHHAGWHKHNTPKCPEQERAA